MLGGAFNYFRFDFAKISMSKIVGLKKKEVNLVSCFGIYYSS